MGGHRENLGITQSLGTCVELLFGCSSRGFRRACPEAAMWAWPLPSLLPAMEHPTKRLLHGAPKHLPAPGCRLLLLAGVMLTSAYQLWREAVPDPDWAGVVPHFRHLTPRELELYDPAASHAHGWFYTTAVTEGQLYTTWLLRRFRGLGGATQCRRVASLEELAGFDVLVNCSGERARVGSDWEGG